MVQEQNTSNKYNPAEYTVAKSVWEIHSFKSSNKVLSQALNYLNNLPSVVGTGPAVSIILDLNTSLFKGYKGDFLKVFGRSFQTDMNLDELVSSIPQTHSDFLFRYFPTYIGHIIPLSLKNRSHVELFAEFKYRREDSYYWLSLRSFKYFSDHQENLGFVNVEYTDITNVKNDACAKFIVYDKSEGYIVNEVLYPNAAILDGLTPKELSIAKLIAKGLSDKEIADVEGSAIGTIKQHKKHIFSKLHINKSTELVAVAYECGLAK